MPRARDVPNVHAPASAMERAAELNLLANFAKFQASAIA